MTRGRRQGGSGAGTDEPQTGKTDEMEVDQPRENDDLEEEEEEEGGVRIGDIYLPPAPPPACTFESDGPRLIITRIVNDNFKSYLGRQVLGPFHKSFTSIIGPNGSGKSNVIDSMLFVFGYRAQKIRSKKISVLIHRSNGHENIDSCSVAVHFQKIIDKGEDDFEPVPGSELVVSRTAHRDNSSHYTVNGRRSQFKQVARLLRQHGIDLDHNRFLILQGEVEQISLMKPKAQTENESGMLEYLEDIVGSSRYKEPIELLNSRVDQLNEHRTEKLNRVKLVEKEKEELEAPKNEVLDYVRLCNKLVSLKNQALQKKIHDCTLVVEENEVERQKVDSEMSELKTQLEEVTERMNAQHGEMKEIQGKLSEVVREKERVDELFKQQGAQDVKINEDMKQLKDRMKKNKTALKNESEKLSELESIPERNSAEISALTERRDQLTAERASAEQHQQTVLASIRHETQHLQDEKDQLESQLSGLRESVNTTKAAMDSAQCELDIYVGNKQSEEAKLEQMKTSHITAQQQVDEKKRLLSQLEASSSTKREQLQQSEQQLEQLNKQLGASQQVLASGRCKLEEMRSALQMCRGRGVVLSSVMEQKRNGALPGVYGRLGDLGCIDEKYDVAVSTACGPLDNIVVDTVDTAQRCIQFLKQNQLGTATFIALDRMEKWRQQATSRIQTPENVPRLFDLVRVADDSVLTAFYFALRDTLVAKDLAQATRIGYGRQRHRVVTLRGDLIEPSGTMSGGGKRTLSGRMNTGSRSASAAAASQQVSPADVELAEADVTSAADNIRQLTRECQQQKEVADALGKQLSKHDVDQRKFHMELQALEEKLATLEAQIQEQTVKVQQATPDPANVKRLTATLDKATAEYEKARSSAAVLEEQVATVHEKIMQITGGKVKAAQKKLDDIVKAFDKCRTDIAKLGQAIKTSERNATKSRDKIKSLESDQEEASKEKESLLAARTKLEEEASDVIAKIKELEERYKMLSQELAALKTKLDSTASEENKAKAAKIQFDQRIEKFVAKIKESQGLISKYKRELDKLELQTLPESDRCEEDIVDLPTLTSDDLQAVQLDRLTYSVTRLEEEISKMKPDMSSLEEYRKKEAVFISRVAELDEITSQRDIQRKYYDDLRKQRLNEFMTGFSIITSKLKEMYQMITLGGDAELELVDSLDPFSEGIVFSVRPPKKSWKNITNLSGGEKTLSSLALVFALHYYKPTPLYVMDEIDAALDFKNVSVVGNYIKERTKNAQFIIISLRSQMFELADRLVGIYKTYDATKSVTINPGLISRGAVAPPAARPVPQQQQQQQEIAASE